MPGLSKDQLEFFRNQGYLLLGHVFDPSLLDTLKNEFDHKLEVYAKKAHAEGLLAEPFENEPFARRLACVAEALDHPDALLELFEGKLHTPGMFKIFTHEAILDIVESVIGPEILAHPQFNSRAKLPRYDEAVAPWHQDLGYLEPAASDTFMVNFWIPLVDANPENGCVEVIAGSHRAPLIDHVQGMGPGGNFKGIADEHLPPGERVLCPLVVGGVLLIMHRTVHRALPNLSDHVRWSLDLRYSDPAMPTGRATVAGFIARSSASPGSVCTSVAQWDEIMAAGTSKG